MTSAGSWGDIIEEAEAERFVGRKQELDILSKEISLSRPRFLIFYIMGQGGAGKTTLLNHFRKIAQDAGFLLTDSDELQRDVPTILGRFAHQLAAQGYTAKHFDDRYKMYRQKMDEIENDPRAPQGLAAMLGRTVIRATYIVGDVVPGVRKGLEFLPREALESQASEWAEYLVKKLSSKDDVALVRDPVSILTPLFFEDLNKIVQKRKLLLCFENFEATRQELQDWLLRLPEYNPSPNIRIAIAGRNQPGEQWDRLRRVTLDVHLDVFTEQEAEAFLDAYGILDDKRRKEIVSWSDRLPVLMGWLAAQVGDDPDPSIPTQSIVERFLRWVTKPELRQVALLAAIPRIFNADILKLLLEKDSQNIDVLYAFDWLLTMPFVLQHSEGWRYHDIVRRRMLHYQRLKTPQTYRQMHTVLSDYYNTKRLELSSSDGEQWTNEQWRKETLGYVYHFLAADPNKNWEEVMSLFALAVAKWRSFAIEIIELLNLEDVHDELSSEQNQTVELFRQKLQAIEKGDFQDGFDMFDKLCGVPGLSSQAKSYTLTHRGESYRLMERYEEALADFDRAIALDNTHDWVFHQRGVIYLRTKRYEEAVADFDRAVALDEHYTMAFAHRGETYLPMGRYEEALADFDRAIALDEKIAWIYVLRGQTCWKMGRYEEALADFDRAIALDEKFANAVACRGQTYRLMGRYQEALTDFNRAIALDGTQDWIYASRGWTYLQMGRYQEALTDFDRALALDEKKDWSFAGRGVTYQLMGRYEEALTDFDRALALDEKDSWTLAHRGRTCQLMGRYEEALTDFDRALALDEKYSWALAHRGKTYRLMGRYEEALTDFNRALALDEKEDWVFAERGQTYRLLERYQEALTDFDRALALDEKNSWALASRGQTYRLMGRYQEALTDFNRALALDEKEGWVFAERGEIYRLMGRYEEALTDFDRALALDEKYSWALAIRGVTYLQTERYQEALTDFDRALALDGTQAWIYASRGQTYLQMGRYQEALMDFDRALALDEKEDWYRYLRAQIHLLTNNESAFISDMGMAIKLAQVILDDASSAKYERIGFNLALYNLVSGNITNAEVQYDQLASACASIPILQDAVNDLKDLLRIQSTNSLAQNIRTNLLIRITELAP